MSKKKETKETKEYEILPVPEPLGRFRIGLRTYDDIIEDTLKLEKGYYQITMPNRKSTSIYMGLKKHIVKQNISNLRVHIIKDTCYLEKTS